MLNAFCVVYAEPVWYFFGDLGSINILSLFSVIFGVNKREQPDFLENNFFIVP